MRVEGESARGRDCEDEVVSGSRLCGLSDLWVGGSETRGCDDPNPIFIPSTHLPTFIPLYTTP